MTAERRDVTRTPTRGTSDPVDARIARSRRVLVDAMLSLLREGAGEALTVSAICARAGVSRSTFYQHFSSPDALLSAAVAERLDTMVDGLEEGHQDPRDVRVADVPALIAAVLAELDRGGAADAYRATLGDITVMRRLQATLEGWISDRLRGAYPHASPMRVAFAAGGVTRSLTQWIDAHGDAARRSADELAAEIWRLVAAVLG